MAIVLYSIFVSCLRQVFQIGRFFSTKIRLGYEGRVNWRQNPSYLSPINKKVLWMHVSSLGEFEQGRPILEQFRRDFPQWHICLSFFSSSGFEIRKNFPLVDSVVYLPLDSKKNATDFLEKTKPDLAIFVKYDFWYFYLTALKQRNCPTLLLAAKFRQDQPFFKPYGSFWRTMLFCFSKISTQDADSLALLASISYTNAAAEGDPRIDRVLELPKTKYEDEKIAIFAHNAKVLVVGSSWNIDVKIITEYLKLSDEYKVILAPHQPNSSAAAFIRQEYPSALAYTTSSKAACQSARVLILDTIGMLNLVYRYGHIAYIGGGFGKGIHNILEPAAYGLPVLFGPRHEEFEEALRLKKSGGGFVVTSSQDFQKHIHTLSDAKNFDIAQKAIQDFFEKQQGATISIMSWIKKQVSQ